MKSQFAFIQNERADLEKQIKEAGRNYMPGYVEQQRKTLLAKQNELFNKVVAGLRQEVKELSDNKREKVRKMVQTAPTAEQLNLLSALNMRDNLTAIELQSIVPAFFGSYQSLRNLETIATKNGITLKLPVQMDARTMFEEISKAEEYLTAACNNIAKEKKNRNVLYEEFFLDDPSRPGVNLSPTYRAFIDDLDSIPQLQDVVTEKTNLTPSEKARIDFYFNDITGEEAILKKTAEVMHDHPDMVEALEVSDYADYVRAVNMMNENGENNPAPEE